ncbi:carbohydrate phosphatase [Trematosphaeria pertusa]|uniref:Carbohydrate phosphatase n=1 Tax=Trematosphaeria pertusa TaxID=390896 RepID=A0A6A6J1B6_9PLEO|nr:carbohydrate phosphatase [Trematosphaeria pertusa]KAF2256436.1 carbohydrate phosphatase [Trematosphaeria pertusa]
MPPSYTEELSLALRVIHTASLLTKSVLRTLKNNVSAETKADDSPVTIADFAAQAVIISALRAAYPSDSFIGEESADQLRKNEDLAERVWQLVQRANDFSAAGESRSSDVQHVQRLGENMALALPASKNEMLHVIDLGTSTQTAEGRVWVLDPVDGTATFMTGNQYAVCLCLLVDGVQQVGVIGAPNLAFDTRGLLGQSRIHEEQVDGPGYGVVLSAVRGDGTYIRAMHASGLGEARRTRHQQTARKELSALDFIETTIGKTSLSQTEHQDVANCLSAKWPGTLLWSQQMKYVALALGATDVMVRLPKGKDRYTYVWDHAGGQLLFQEAGGIVKDLDGGDIDFAQGRKIEGYRNFGMVAAMPWAFDKVHEAAREVMSRRTR